MNNNPIVNAVKKPQVINNTHESVYRCYSILEHVLTMVERGDSKETIKEVAQAMNYIDHKINLAG